ncbi:MAG: MFS transporter, partial [Dehalococcoidia bacterium]|nr:MFS transporter [Dehalococcoidia bacterium]
GTLGGVLGGTIMAPLTQGIINGQGWREAWLFFGIMAFSVAILPWLFLRRLPEDLGLLPDGDGRAEEERPSTDAPSRPARRRQAEFNLTFGEAVRTAPFWILCLMMAVSLMATTGVTFNMSPHFTDVGISEAAAAAAISIFTLFQAPSVFLWGFVADRRGAKQAVMGVLLTLAVGTWLIARAHSSAFAYLGSAVLGAGMGGTMLAMDVVWADFFGRKHLGNIRGASMAFQMVGNASGSIIAAMLYDWKGSYDLAFKFIIGALVVSCLVLTLARKPTTKADVAT